MQNLWHRKHSMKQISLLILVGFIMTCHGCALKRVKSSTKFGPSFRHKGSNRTDSIRWTEQQSYSFKWEEGVTTGIQYRRRDADNGNGNNDNGVFLDFSYPIWKKKSRNKSQNTFDRMKKLELRLANLEERSKSIMRTP